MSVDKHWRDPEQHVLMVDDTLELGDVFGAVILIRFVRIIDSQDHPTIVIESLMRDAGERSQDIKNRVLEWIP